MYPSAHKLGRVIKKHATIFALCFSLLFIFTVYSNNIANAEISQPDVKPIHITLSRLNIDLPIAESRYDSSTREWQISNVQAHFANTTSALNAKSGATLIYAHNKAGLFGELSALQVGDMISILGSDNRTHQYSYVRDEIVLPTNGSIFSYQGPHELVLLCCNGPNDETRRLMYFNELN